MLPGELMIKKLLDKMFKKKKSGDIPKPTRPEALKELPKEVSAEDLLSQLSKQGPPSQVKEPAPVLAKGQPPAEAKQSEIPQPAENPTQGGKKMDAPLDVPKPPVEHGIFDKGDKSVTGIIIDLGDNISLNVPIKKRMTLEEFLSVAEKVRSLERLDTYEG